MAIDISEKSVTNTGLTHYDTVFQSFGIAISTAGNAIPIAALPLRYPRNGPVRLRASANLTSLRRA